MTFNIGNQQARTINNVAGDQVNVEAPGAQVFPAEDARRELQRLRQALAGLDLPPQVRALVDRQMGAADDELSAPEPDRSALAERLRGISQILTSAGALAAAGQALAVPLTNLVHLVGA